MNSHPNMAKAKSWFTAALRRGLCSALLLGGMAALAQGLPEPGIILYGSVTNSATGAGMTSGNVAFTFTNGANTLTVSAPITNVGGQSLYVLEVPFETLAAGLTASPATALPLPASSATFGRGAKVDNTNAVILDVAGVSFTVSATDRGRQLRVNLQLQAAAAPVVSGISPAINLVVLRTNAGSTYPAAFTVNAANATSYQWSFASTTIPGETGSTLLIPNARRVNNGVYSVTVTGPGGTVTTNATLHVIVPQRVQTVQRLADGSVRLLFRDDDAGLPNDLARLEVHSTTNLRAPITWTTNASPLVLTNGFVQFEDMHAIGGPRRFYRIIER
jgi:hypothetical protein